MDRRDESGASVRGALLEPAAPGFDPQAAGWTVHDEEPGFADTIGPIWQSGANEAFRLGFLARPAHANRRGVVHGGMVMSFADQLLGAVAIEAVAGRPLATVQLDTHFIDAIAVGEFVEGTARVERRTRSMLFMSGSIFVGDRLVAMAHGIWKILATAPRPGNPDGAG